MIRSTEPNFSRNKFGVGLFRIVNYEPEYDEKRSGDKKESS